MAAGQTIEFRSAFSRETQAASLVPGETRSLGSAGEIPLYGPEVREHHAQLKRTEQGWTVAPSGDGTVTVNGLLLNGPAIVQEGDWLSLGESLFQVHFPGSASAPVSQPTPPRRTRPTGLLTIGRLPECDLSLDSPLVSREHARLHCTDQAVELEDLGSTNGTYVNGERLLGRVRLRQGDRIAVASFHFLFTGESLEPIDLSGQLRVEVRGLTKTVIDQGSNKPKRLLDDVNLVIEPGEFVVIFGTSGSGKSTLLDALNGRRPATEGQVLYNGEDLYANFDAFRSSIGYVPQQDIVHRKITVRRALQYTAQLRLPVDTSPEETDSYIELVLDKVGLGEKADLPIDTPAPLSGGQLKRVCLAVELVANPNILFLDEVTSGLDAGTDKRMMRLFAELAADKKTVVCVTHTLENIDTCHLVVLLHQGQLVYFGPPGEAAGYFGVSRLSEVYELLEASPAQQWSEQFRASPFYRLYISQRQTQGMQESGGSAPLHSMMQPKAAWFDGRQALTLLRRYVDLILADKKNLLILLLQAPLIALVVGLVFKIEGHAMQKAQAEVQVVFMLVLSAIWFGTLNSARELVKELPVYLRERSVNLGLLPYLSSKLIPLAALCLIQCASLLGIVMGMLELPGDFLPRLVVLFASGLAASCMGLAVSAFVDSNDKAVAMAPILLIPQVILSNAVVKLGTAGLWVAKSSMISFWALDAIKTTLRPESRAYHEIVAIQTGYGLGLGMLAVLGTVFLTLAILGLKLKDRKS